MLRFINRVICFYTNLGFIINIILVNDIININKI